MHETDAVYLIKTVFDFFIAKEFKGTMTDNEYNLSLLCFQDFVKDREPYWVRAKAKLVISRLLYFKDEIGDCPATLKEAVLSVIRDVRDKLGKDVEKELNISDSVAIRRDIKIPEFIKLDSWARSDWNRSKKPLIFDEHW